ncbi:MAG: hypothetical protein JXP72_01505 [Coriobacteriia bacterium]|nr:hypothetical protein [Coriobacteriia bacterium]
MPESDEITLPDTETTPSSGATGSDESVQEVLEPVPIPEPETSAETPVEAEPDAEPETLPGALPADETTSPAAAPIAPAAPDSALVEAVGGGLTWVPFAVYLGLWLALAGVSAYLFGEATPEEPARFMPEYPLVVWAGVALAGLGPVVSLVTWLVARTRRAAEARRGLLASALTRGALAAFFGVTIWIVTLTVLDVLAAGGAL